MRKMKKRGIGVRLFSIAMAVLMIITFLPISTISTVVYAVGDEWSGTGEGSNPYLIETVSHLKKLAEQVNNGNSYADQYFVVENDLDLSAVNNWTPIGTSECPFAGTFLGGNHEISGLKVNGGDYCGLFGWNSGTIRNLTVNGSVKGGTHIGGIAGKNSGSIQNCEYYGSVEEKDSDSMFAGGIAGTNEGIITNCINFGSISNGSRNGGIAGENKGTISFCTNQGNISARYCYIGGIVGENNGLITECLNHQNASISSEIWNLAGYSNTWMYVGGIAGHSRSDSIQYCTNEANIRANSRVGGIVGYLESGSLTECVNTGELSDCKYDIGGIAGSVGENVTVTNCSNFGKITGELYAGGIVGSVEGILVGGVLIKNCFNSGQVDTNVHADAGGIVGYFRGDDKENPLGVLNCTNMGEVSGGNDTGGIVGLLENYTVKDCINYGSVKNIKSDIYKSDYAGGIVGCMYDGFITKCTNYGEISGDNGEMGGILGFCFRGAISDSINNGKIWGHTNAGGIAGVCGKIDNCQNNAEVTGESYVGGIVGQCAGGLQSYMILEKDVKLEGEIKARITRCINTGAVSASGGDENCIGGIAGYCNCSIVELCYNSAAVSGNSYVGGIVGINDRNQSYDNKILKCHNDGDITGTAGDIGGIIGLAKICTMEECGNNGQIISTDIYIGGVAGRTIDTSVKDCYNRGAVYGNNQVGGIIGRTNESLSLENSYCKGPDDGPNKGTEGVDCITDSVIFDESGYTKLALVGGILGAQGKDSPLTMSHVYWWTGCSYRACGWLDELWGHHDGDDYGFYKVQSRFTKTDNFPGWDFSKVWIIDANAGAPVLRCEGEYKNISPSGGTGGTGGKGGMGGKGNTIKEITYINSLKDLENFRDSVNKGTDYEGQTVYLYVDVDLGDKNWTPIGTSEHPFRGTFDGLGHSIKKLNVNTTSYGGFFGCVEYGTIEKLAVYGSVTSSSSRTGGIVGLFDGNIRYCLFVGNVTATTDDNQAFTGGIAGSTNYGGYLYGVSDCCHIGTVKTKNGSVGGIIGGLGKQSHVKNCFHYNGSVESEDGSAGGVVGLAFLKSYVNNCFAIKDSASEVIGDNRTTIYDCAMFTTDEFLNQKDSRYGSWNMGSEEGHIWAMGIQYPVLQCLSEHYTLSSNGGDEDRRILWFAKGESILPDVQFTKKGYTLSGWNSESDGSGQIYYIGDSVAPGSTIYAQWVKGVPYHGYFTTSVSAYTGVSEAENYTKLIDNNIKTKWCVANLKGGEELSIEFASKDYIRPCSYGFVTGGDAEKYKNRNPVSWTLEGKSGVNEEWVIIDDVEDSQILPDRNSFFAYKEIENSDEYCYFRMTFHWNGIKVFQLSEFYLMVADLDKDVRKPRVTLNANGADVDDYKVLTGIINSTVKIPENPYSRGGYLFKGWNTKANGNGVFYQKDDELKITEDFELFAQWEAQKYTIRFNGTSDGTEEYTLEYTPDDQIAFPARSQEGYIFNGWRVVARDGNWAINEGPYTAESVVTGRYGNIIMTGYWTELPQYLVRWKNYDSSVLKSEYVYKGVVPKYTGDNPTKPEDDENVYVFAGWDKTPEAVDGAVDYTAVYESTKKKYTITWLNDDGTLIDTTSVEYGTVPTHADATKDATNEFTYTFAGWDKTPVAVTGAATYQATFSETKNKYTITWLNDDGTLIDTTSVEYGTVPTHADATKTATDETTYVFSGWTPNVVAVTGAATYQAVFSDTKNSYTITWLNDDGTLIDTTTVEYGTVPTHADATKTATDETTYVFSGWTPNVVAVTGAATYQAVFSDTKNSYTITWLNDDGTLIDTTTVEYGTVPTHADATKEATAEFTYTFTGWDATPVAVTGTATYKATFSETKNQYTITWLNEDGTLIDTTTVEYGTIPTHADVSKEATDETTYIFSGWMPNIVAVTGVAEYKAVFSDAKNSYEITWLNDDGTLIDTTTVEYGTVPTHADATKEATAEFTYTFTGWDTTPVAVTGTATYKATFSETKNQYTITWLNEDGILIDTTTVEYGTIPTHADATKEATAEFTYTFTGWDTTPVAVTGATTYKAIFSATRNKYTITWLNDEGTLIDTTEVEYGTVPTHADVTKAETAEYTYTFTGWNVTPMAVTGTATYQATFSATAKKSEEAPSQNTNSDQSGDYLDELRIMIQAAIKAGGKQTVKWAKGTALPRDIMETLEQHPDVTVIFKYTYENKDYRVVIQNVKTIKSVRWYGPLFLNALFGEDAKSNMDAMTNVYIVKRGNTLSGIAKMLNVTVKYLVAVNGIKNPDLIWANQRINY